MKSLHSEEFNHDQWASEYDEDVSDESHPIREGYDRVLDWVIQEANIKKNSTVLELGSGTGNLTLKIKECKKIVCVDVSAEMESVATSKTGHLEKEFIKNDILEVFESDLGIFDAVISTYTIHHLTEIEKHELFSEIWRILSPSGVAIFGDLMVEDEGKKNERIKYYNDHNQDEVASAIEDEYFWNIEKCTQKLISIGFNIEVIRFSDLSFGIAAKKTRPNKTLDSTKEAAPHSLIPKS